MYNVYFSAYILVTLAWSLVSVVKEERQDPTCPSEHLAYASVLNCCVLRLDLPLKSSSKNLCSSTIYLLSAENGIECAFIDYF